MRKKNTLYLCNASKSQRNEAGGYVHLHIPDRIYLNLDFIDDSDEMLMNTLIHEASHLFAQSKDYNKYYSTEKSLISSLIATLFLENSSALKEMLAYERIQHASSLENFVSDLVSTPGKLHTKVQLNKEIPGYHYIHTNTGTLFPARKNTSLTQENLTSLAIATGTAVVTYTVLSHLIRKL